MVRASEDLHIPRYGFLFRNRALSTAAPLCERRCGDANQSSCRRSVVRCKAHVVSRLRRSTPIEQNAGPACALPPATAPYSTPQADPQISPLPRLAKPDARSPCDGGSEPLDLPQQLAQRAVSLKPTEHGIAQAHELLELRGRARSHRRNMRLPPPHARPVPHLAPNRGSRLSFPDCAVGSQRVSEVRAARTGPGRESVFFARRRR